MYGTGLEKLMEKRPFDSVEVIVEKSLKSKLLKVVKVKHELTLRGEIEEGEEGKSTYSGVRRQKDWA